MMSRWRWLLTLLSRKLWLRVSVMALIGVATAAAGIVFAPYVPEAWTIKIGAQAIDGILNVLASSMLAVTVFSLSTMVAAYGAATNNVTPRATKLLMEDQTSQNVLGTFIGAFLFSLVGIIALSTGLYGSQGRAILLVVTIGLIALIAVTILRWIDYLARFGRLGETIQRVEEATWKAMKTRLSHPHLGGRPMDGGAPADAWPVFTTSIGYVQHIDVAELEDCAGKVDRLVFVLAVPGAFADPARPVAMVSGPQDDDIGNAVAQAFTVGAERTFDQDPRFGLCVLAEIASRALSPAVNDPGTAIDVIGRGVRLLAQWARFKRSEIRRRDRLPARIGSQHSGRRYARRCLCADRPRRRWHGGNSASTSEGVPGVEGNGPTNVRRRCPAAFGNRGYARGRCVNAGGGAERRQNHGRDDQRGSALSIT